MLCGAHPDTLTTYRTAAGARLELRHSSRCGTSWARMWARTSATASSWSPPARPGPPR
ncbi:DUF2690 domain-containing protein [Streptomyces thermocarboxydus]